MSHNALFRAFNGSIWAIVPTKMDEICGFLTNRFDGLQVDAATIEKVAATNRSGAGTKITRSVAVMPIYGTIMQRVGMMDEASGGISTEQIGRAFDTLIKDDSIGAIIMDIDSPGGNYAGTPELAEKIYQARGSKPIVAVANSMAASAAYWIGSAADELVVTPSGDVGSIGVLAVHYDMSAANEAEGIKPTYVTYGRYKAEYSEDAPLSPEALTELQRRVDDAGENFVKAVAKQRGVSPGIVREKFGQGRMFNGAEAIERGMADRVATLEATIERLANGGRVANKGKRAAIERQKLGVAKYK